jgi:hypothetical protein
LEGDIAASGALAQSLVKRFGSGYFRFDGTLIGA